MQKVNHILFYVEPWIELSADFRLGAYGHYFNLGSNIEKTHEHVDVRFLMSDNLFNIVLNEKPQWVSSKTYLIDLQKLQEIYCDSQVASHHNYNAQSTITNQHSAISNLISSIFSDEWQPDVIIMHETHAPFLHQVFPRALILHGMYGMTHKEPFPQTYLFDNLGLYSNSVFNTQDVLADIEISDDDKQWLYKIKNWYAQQIIPHDPTWGVIEYYQSRFDKLILLPLQVDNYFAFTECSRYQTQLEYLQDVLEKMPKNWGVIVTGHSNYERMVSDKNFIELQLKYINLIQLDELDKIPFVSQALLPHVDAVVSISSSLALQALLFNKPVVVAGNSHINKTATCDLANIHHVFDKPYDEQLNFKILKFFFTKYHLLANKKLDNYANLYHYINQYYQNFLNAQSDNDIILPTIYENLADYFHDVQQCSQWRQWNDLLSTNDISKKINPVLQDIVFHDIISWDLFDTLVDRPFVHPHELFQLVEDKLKYLTNNIYLPFHMLRRESERLARLNYQREVTLDEIYEFFYQKTQLPQQKIELIKQIELQTELECIKPRKLMQRTWQFAKILGKTRSIITDIYLDKDTIETVVRKNGYGDYDNLLISSVEMIRKEDGTIYPMYLENMKKNHGIDKTFLHIGDNPRADGEMARRFGITSHVIPKAIDQLNQSLYAKMLEKPLKSNSYDTSMIISLIANRFFSSPKTYFDKNSLSNHQLYTIGYSVLGSFVLSYVQWVINKLQNYKVDKVYFLARDGYLIMQVYDLLKDFYKNLPDSQYLLCSRRGVVVPSISTVDDILETAMLNYGATTLQSFLQSRFGLDIVQIPKKVLQKYGFSVQGENRITFPLDMPKTNAFVLDIQQIIFKQAKQERNLYLQYLNEQGVNDDCNIAMVDIGYSGTMQRKIRAMTGKSYIGLYMLTHNYAFHYFKDEIFEGWLGSYDNQRATIRHEFNDFIPLIESMLSSDAGSFNNFYLDKNGKCQVNYLYSEQELHRCYFVNSIQQGALDFVKDYIDRLGKFSSDIHLSAKVGSNTLFELGKNPAESDVALFEGLLLENMFAGSEFNIIANPMPFLNKHGKLTNESYQQLIQISKWKQGAVVAYQKYLDKPKTNITAEIITHQPTPKKQSENLNKKERLYRKVNTTPERFVKDLKLMPKPVKQVIIQNQTLLNITQSVFKAVLSK